MRVLIVEDEPNLAHAYARTLVAAGFECVLAATPEDACEQLERQDLVAPIDVMILDVEMQGAMGGAMVAKYAQLYERVRTIVISGHSRAHVEGDVARPFSSVLAWLDKPVTDVQLLNEVHRAIRTR